MTNRERYITKKSEYDLMLNIMHNTSGCPIEAIGAVPIDTHTCIHTPDCKSCIQNWLNKKEEER